MPYCLIQTSVSLEATQRAALQGRLSQLVSQLLGKPEAYVMTRCDSNASMTFGGTADPCAYCELTSLGMEEDTHRQLAQSLSEFLVAELGTPADRIFIRFDAPPRSHFAWNGKLFG